LLGIALILAGAMVLGDLALAMTISTILIGGIAIAAGAFEIIHAFWTEGWGGLVWQIVLGALYVAVGIVLVSEPSAGALIVKYVLGLALLLSGIVRVLLGINHWDDRGWIMFSAGVFGVLAGLVILTGFPRLTLWFLGLLIGIDLIVHGLAWLSYAWRPGVQDIVTGQHRMG